MLVANSFELWQKDTFFSAAEEVQQSADIMESAYRTWLRARREGVMPQHFDELSRELQMALGTAKWQLEEFEKAVRMSYRNNGDDITITRHNQFVSAIEDQISRVETSLNDEGKRPFRWVNLDDEEECDDLALFLSGTPETSQRVKDEDIKLSISNTNQDRSNEDIDCIIELRDNKFSETVDDNSFEGDQVSSNRRVWSSPERAALEIVIDMDDKPRNVLTEATPKEKGSKPFFWTLRGEIHNGMRGMLSHTQMKLICWTNQHFRRGHRSPRQQQVSQMLPVNSLRIVLALMLTIFLFVPFVLYST